MKTNKILFIALVIIVSACGSNNYFDRWPGEKLQSFPKELQGNYKLNIGFFNGLLGGKKMDSLLYLTIDGNSIHEINKTANQENILSDSLVLSKLGAYYVVSSLSQENKGFWTLGYFKIVKNGLHYMPYMGADKPSKDNLAKYLNFIASFKNGKTTINALPINDRIPFYSFHSDTINYYEMNDLRFLDFMESEKADLIIKFNKINTKK
jgi:hypothetical protein